MGSYIGMGIIVKNKFSSKENSAMQKIIEYFISKNGKLIDFKFSEDKDGYDWKHIENPPIYTIDEFLNKYYLNINLICDILGKENVVINAYYENIDENEFGLSLDIEEKLFITDYPDEKIEEITNEFINLLVDLYTTVKYSYAFCDVEAMVKYATKDIEKAKKKYSLLIIPHFNKIEIVKNAWNIDGLTDRMNVGIEYIPILNK